jgi:hypothetical protein
MAEFPNEKQNYFDCLQNIEDWLNSLTTTMQNSNATAIKFDDRNIEETCSCIVKNLNDGFPGMTPERHATVIITTLNILIRIYAADKFNLITSHEKFRFVIELYIRQITIAYFIQSSDMKKYAAGMLDLLLMNFAQDNFIVKCLEQFFLTEPTSITGKVE